jgi:chromosome segregation ATPase
MTNISEAIELLQTEKREVKRLEEENEELKQEIEGLRKRTKILSKDHVFRNMTIRFYDSTVKDYCSHMQKIEQHVKSALTKYSVEIVDIQWNWETPINAISKLEKITQCNNESCDRKLDPMGYYIKTLTNIPETSMDEAAFYGFYCSEECMVEELRKRGHKL